MIFTLKLTFSLPYFHCHSTQVTHHRNIMKVGDVTKKPPPQTDIKEDIDNCLAAIVNNILGFWKRWILGLTVTALGVGSIFIFTNRHEIFGTCPSGWRNERPRGLGCLHVHLKTMRVDQAEQYCDNLGSHLLEIYTREQLNFTRTLLMEIMEEEEMRDMDEVDWYLGGTDMDTGSFMWPKVGIYSLSRCTKKEQ